MRVAGSREGYPGTHMAGACGNRTHRSHRRRLQRGFEDRPSHQARSTPINGAVQSPHAGNRVVSLRGNVRLRSGIDHVIGRPIDLGVGPRLSRPFGASQQFLGALALLLQFLLALLKAEISLGQRDSEVGAHWRAERLRLGRVTGQDTTSPSLLGDQLVAMTSISTRTPRGNPATATVERAGL